jgi:hypothetical protein
MLMKDELPDDDAMDEMYDEAEDAYDAYLYADAMMKARGEG